MICVCVSVCELLCYINIKLMFMQSLFYHVHVNILTIPVSIMTNFGTDDFHAARDPSVPGDDYSGSMYIHVIYF